LATTTWLSALFLGVLEGLTEFLPISSTGHLLLASLLIDFDDQGDVFTIVIQLGAILAVCLVYWRRLLGVTFGLGSDPAARRFVRNLLIAFLPAMVIGALAHGFIKRVLFSPEVGPWVIATALVLGGLVMLLVERRAPAPVVRDVDELSPRRALAIGFFQVVAMIPGVSRSGATIVGALMLGVERRAAMEFSFFLAIPTMAGATAYDLYKNWALLGSGEWNVIAIGLVAAFVTALLVVRSVVGFIGRFGFAPFAWYRIAAGCLMLTILVLR
jgi:undecaprenyl-diphosphatase